MRVKCLAQERNTMFPAGLESGPFDPERLIRSRATVALWQGVNTGISFTYSLLERRKLNTPSASCTEASVGSK